MQATLAPRRRSKRPPMRPRSIARRSLRARRAARGCTAAAEEVRPPRRRAVLPDRRWRSSPDESRRCSSPTRTPSSATTPARSRCSTSTRSIGSSRTGSTSGVDPAGLRAGSRAQRDADLRRGDVHPPRDAGVRIGNFATDIAVQDLGGGALRLSSRPAAIPRSRGSTGTARGCRATPAAQGFALCDDDHRLSFVHERRRPLGIPDEPFGVFADTRGRVRDGHAPDDRRGHADRLADAPATRSIADVLDRALRRRPVDRPARRDRRRGPPPSADGRHRLRRQPQRGPDPDVHRRPPGQRRAAVPAAGQLLLPRRRRRQHRRLDATRAAWRSRRPATRLYLVNRRPPSLQIFDTSLGPTGFPQQPARSARPTSAARPRRWRSPDAGDGERAYVTCFQDGQLYVDRSARPVVSVEDIVLVGRGPYSVAAARTAQEAAT